MEHHIIQNTDTNLKNQIINYSNSLLELIVDIRGLHTYKYISDLGNKQVLVRDIKTDLAYIITEKEVRDGIRRYKRHEINKMYSAHIHLIQKYTRAFSYSEKTEASIVNIIGDKTPHIELIRVCNHSEGFFIQRSRHNLGIEFTLDGNFATDAVCFDDNGITTNIFNASKGALKNNSDAIDFEKLIEPFYNNGHYYFNCSDRPEVLYFNRLDSEIFNNKISSHNKMSEIEFIMFIKNIIDNNGTYHKNKIVG